MKLKITELVIPGAYPSSEEPVAFRRELHTINTNDGAITTSLTEIACDRDAWKAFVFRVVSDL
eukprot:5629191-Amphidinium_carterae.1